jgi:hypothetical protein
MNIYKQYAPSQAQIGVQMATETENVSEENLQEEVVQPQTEDSIEETQSQETQEASPQPKEDNSKEYNFRKMRERLEQLEQENQRYREIKQASQEEELGEDDLVEGRHFKKGLNEIKEMIRQKELESVPEKLRGKFEDFDQVVTKENLEKLKDTEPELFFSIQSGDGRSANGLYAKGVAAYKTLKSLGYSPDGQNIMKQKDHVQSNHKKPLSAQAIKGSGALHEANIFAQGLTPELKKQLQKEMAEAAKAR